MTCLIQEMSLNKNKYRMNPSLILHKFKNNREGTTLAVMNDVKGTEKTLIAFGGL